MLLLQLNTIWHAGLSIADHEAFWAEWALRIQTLETGIGQARGQGISVSKAKRVLKELQAQANAAEAASKLQAVLQRKSCKASALKVSCFKHCELVPTTCPVGVVLIYVTCSPVMAWMQHC